MGVHRECRHPEGLGHDDARRLVSDTGKFLQLLERTGHPAAVLCDQYLRAVSRSFLAFCGESPQGRMISRIFSTGSFAIFCGVSARAKRAGVTSFTFLSVHWAERTTETSSVKASLWSSGIGVSG